MSRAKLITILKLAVVALLMAIVFANVQWADTYIRLGPEGEVQEQRTGKIIGPWDEPEVRFVLDGPDGQPTGEERVVRQGDDSTGESVSPGFTTFILNLDWPLFVLGALCYWATVMLSATRWWWLLLVNDLRVSWWTACRFTWIGLFFNNIVPGQTGGDVVKALYIIKHCEGGRLVALMSVLVDRVLGLASLALLGAIAVLFVLDKPNFGVMALSIWGVLLGVTLLGIAAFSKRIRRRIRLNELIAKLPPRISGPLRKIDQAVFFYRSHKTGIAVWGVIGVANHAVSVASTMLMGKALNVGMPALEYFVLVPLINILSALPLGPNGWGVAELAFRSLFGTFGAPYLAPMPVAQASAIMGTRGVALSILFRIHLTLWSLLGGLLMLFDRDRPTRSEIEEEVALEAQPEALAPGSSG